MSRYETIETAIAFHENNPTSAFSLQTRSGDIIYQTAPILPGIAYDGDLMDGTLSFRAGGERFIAIAVPGGHMLYGANNLYSSAYARFKKVMLINSAIFIVISKSLL